MSRDLDRPDPGRNRCGQGERSDEGHRAQRQLSTDPQEGADLGQTGDPRPYAQLSAPTPEDEVDEPQGPDPLSHQCSQRRAAKPYIDVAARRMGDILGGFSILLLLFFIPKLPVSVVTGGAVLSAGVALWLAASLHHGYIAQLAQSLRSGSVSMRATEALDATTMQTAEPGLYAIGEAVDVTGWLGGYNFQWAWSSGHAAGSAL